VSHRVAAVVADGLARSGAARAFAARGAQASLADALRARGVAVVETAGATAACVMAAVTAELVDAPGVAMVSLDRGIGPVMDGAAHATRDRAGVVVISDGAADARLLDPVVKASAFADPASAAHWIAHAVQAAMADPRGAVHLAIRDAAAQAPALPIATAVRPAPLAPPPGDRLDVLADTIARAVRPVLIVGLEAGVEDAKWIRALAESLPAPVLTTPKGKGALPDPHPLAIGLIGAAHPLLAQADLVVAIGVDAVELRPGIWPAGVPLAHVSRAPRDDAVSGAIALIIEELAPRLRGRARADWDVAALDRLTRSLRPPTTGPGFARRRVVEIAREMTTAGTILALDVPLADAWASVNPRECLMPNGVATLGFALPAALAATLARDGVRIVAVGAAAGFNAMAAEWATAARLGAPIVAIALNHEGATDVATAARGAGVVVAGAADEAGFRMQFEEAWRAHAATLIDVHVSR